MKLVIVEDDVVFLVKVDLCFGQVADHGLHAGDKGADVGKVIGGYDIQAMVRHKGGDILLGEVEIEVEPTVVMALDEFLRELHCVRSERKVKFS